MTVPNYISINIRLQNINHQFRLKNNVIHTHFLLSNNVVTILVPHDIIFLINSMYHNLKIVKFFLYQLL